MSSSFKIGVLSDSHKEHSMQHQAVLKLKQEGAKYLLHLGDLELVYNLEELSSHGLPYAAVFGNNDYTLSGLDRSFNIHKEPYYLKIRETSIKMMHMPYYMSGDTNIVLFGHTHQFSVEFKNGTLFLNPGEVCAREKNLTECAIIEVKDSEYIVTYYFKEPKSTTWSSKAFSFVKI